MRIIGLVETWLLAASIVEPMQGNVNDAVSVLTLHSFPFTVSYHIRSKEIYSNLCEVLVPIPKCGLEGSCCLELKTTT